MWSDVCYTVRSNGDSCKVDCDDNKCDIEVCKEAINGDCTSTKSIGNVGTDNLYIFNGWEYVESDSSPNEDPILIYNENKLNDVTVTLDVTQYDDLPTWANGNDGTMSMDKWGMAILHPNLSFGKVDLTFEIPTANWEDDILFVHEGVEVGKCHTFKYNSSSGTSTLTEFDCNDLCPDESSDWWY